MKKYQKGFIGWMIPALYGILATMGGFYMVLTGSYMEKLFGVGIIVIAIITFRKVTKHIFPKKNDQGAP